MYEVEFPDGSREAISANLIAENIYSQVDDFGRQFSIIKDIVDHKKDGTAVSKDDAYLISKSGQRWLRPTTKGWFLEVEWKDGTSNWIALKDLKESNPIEVAEYAVANKIAEEPAFAWWVRDVLRKRNRIIMKAKTRYWAKTHKFGIELPKSVNVPWRLMLERGLTSGKRPLTRK